MLGEKVDVLVNQPMATGDHVEGRKMMIVFEDDIVQN